MEKCLTMRKGLSICKDDNHRTKHKNNNERPKYY